VIFNLPSTKEAYKGDKPIDKENKPSLNLLVKQIRKTKEQGRYHSASMHTSIKKYGN